MTGKMDVDTDRLDEILMASGGVLFRGVNFVTVELVTMGGQCGYVDWLELIDSDGDVAHQINLAHVEALRYRDEEE